MIFRNFIISLVGMLKENYFVKYIFPKNQIIAGIIKNIYSNYLSNFDPENLLYKEWIKKNEPSDEDLLKQRKIKIKYQPLISIIVPVYNTRKIFLIEMLQSVLNQTYINWELCISEGNSEQDYIKQILTSYSENDQRIKVIFLKKNFGIAENSNKAIELARGEYITFLDHDDILSPFALFEVVKMLNEYPEVDIFYSDQDNISEDGRIRNFPYFKPEFAIDNIRSGHYMCHLFIIKRTLGESIGWFKNDFEGAQDYDLTLRALEKTRRVKHIAKVLYHWRMHEKSMSLNRSSKPYAFKSGTKALYEHLTRSKVEFQSIEFKILGRRVIYPIELGAFVSIIIINSDNKSTLKRCLKSLIETTKYKDFEIIIVENTYKKRQDSLSNSIMLNNNHNIKIISNEKTLSHSIANNLAVENSRGKYLLFLHNDVRIFKPDWLSNMLEFICRQDVGVVGAKLYSPNKKIQHGGFLITRNGDITHPHPNFEKEDQRYWADTNCIRNFCAVSGVCLLSQRDIFDEVDGFDERFNSTYMEVDFCLKVRRKGYNVVWTPYSEIIHYGSIKHNPDKTIEDHTQIINEIKLFKEKWESFLDKGDPFFNPNIYMQEKDFIIKV